MRYLLVEILSKCLLVVPPLTLTWSQTTSIMPARHGLMLGGT